jgi:hypothetical protein
MHFENVLPSSELMAMWRVVPAQFLNVRPIPAKSLLFGNPKWPFLFAANMPGCSVLGVLTAGYIEVGELKLRGELGGLGRGGLLLANMLAIAFFFRLHDRSTQT